MAGPAIPCGHCVTLKNDTLTAAHSSIVRSVSVHAAQGGRRGRILAVEPFEDPVLEDGVHHDRHNGHEDVDGRLLPQRGCTSAA